MKLFDKKKEIFSNMLGNRSKIFNLNHQEINDVNRELRPVIFYPTATKEWYNSIYAYNKIYIKSLVHKDNIVNNIIKNYFNFNILSINDKLKFRRRRIKSRRYSAKRIFVSRAEIKHTNTKVLITVYTYNKHKNYFIYKFRKIKRTLTNFIFKKINKFTWVKIKKKTSDSGKSIVLKNIPSIINLYYESLNLKSFKEFFKISINNNKVIINKQSVLLPEPLNFIYLIKKLLKKSFSLKKKSLKIMLYWYYKRILILNKYKFTYLFLNLKGIGLINLLSNIYDKQVEFNIVDLKSVHLDGDVFSHSMALKLKNRKIKLLRVLKKALRLVNLPDRDLILNNNYNSFVNKRENVLNSLKTKVVSGIRLEGSGRLTRRLTASRSVFKFRYKGSIKNLDSSSNSLSTVMLRGHVKSNLQYRLINSKTRNGAFGLKSWISSF